MSVDGKIVRARSATGSCTSTPRLATLAPNVAGKRSLLHAAMDSGLFEGLQGCGLGVGQARLRATLGERPASAAGLDQQEFDAPGGDPIADGGNLFASTQFAKMR